MSKTYEAIAAMYEAFNNYLLDRAIASGDLVWEDGEEHPPLFVDEPEDEIDDEDLPPLFEDEIAEILDEHKGEEILVHHRPEGPVRFRYYGYKKDKRVVFTIYDALINHCLVTVNGTNIVDL